MSDYLVSEEMRIWKNNALVTDIAPVEYWISLVEEVEGRVAELEDATPPAALSDRIPKSVAEEARRGRWLTEPAWCTREDGQDEEERMSKDFYWHKEAWRGEYQSIGWRLDKNIKVPLLVQQLNQSDWWCWYLYLVEAQMSKQLFRTLWLPPEQQTWGINYDYYDCELINQIDFHGDCTYYKKLGGFDNIPRIIEVGCDYNHLRDTERGQPSFGAVLADIHSAIEGLRVLVPELKWRCWCTGRYYDLAEGAIMDNGKFLSNEAQQARDEAEQGEKMGEQSPSDESLALAKAIIAELRPGLATQIEKKLSDLQERDRQAGEYIGALEADLRKYRS